MPVFTLTCSVTVSAFTKVKANTLGEAIAEAAGRPVELWFYGSDVCPSESWCIEDGDGEPQCITGCV